MSDLVARAMVKLNTDRLSAAKALFKDWMPITTDVCTSLVALMQHVERVPDAIIIPEVREANERLARAILGEQDGRLVTEKEFRNGERDD